MPPLTPLSISYEKLLPMIQGLSDFSGLDPLERTHPQGIVVGDVPSTRIMAIQQRHADLSSILVERLIKAGHLKQYLRSDNGGRDAPNSQPRA
ncbi:hypothetical protein CK203_068760 [Vitis vinifera]|uniref:Uncharacterized protein n=1 Tax=Vitis vinifera TaxID=29760 RepID=A0A438EY50_VITVI|nr:hypothetical protein CK203_068760 [Vitis vinifera]